MERKKIVAGNWKMNKTLGEAIELTSLIMKSPGDNSVTKIIFPPFPFISALSNFIGASGSFATGAQNCSEHASGAFTGEVSAAMLKSIGCKYVLVGHSERRQYFGETNATSAKKIKLVTDNGMKAIYCVGETLEERKANTHFDIVRTQLTEALKGANPENIIVAYEPVWAIGTGETATQSQAQEMHSFIRECLKKIFNAEAAENTSILYGGSCNPQNAKELFVCPDIDGGLIGGASLKAEDFSRVARSF